MLIGVCVRDGNSITMAILARISLKSFCLERPLKTVLWHSMMIMDGFSFKKYDPEAHMKVI